MGGRLAQGMVESSVGKLPPMGATHWRSWVGPPDYFDRMGVLQFLVLVLLGMREHDTLLDIGCGSFRGGRFSIMYLQEGRYCGIEPEPWVVEEGISQELSTGLAALKRPRIAHNDDFDASVFGVSFDYIMASGIFMHACPAQITKCFGSAQSVLAPQGLFIGAYLEGDSDSNAHHWTYPHIQRYTRAGLERLAGQAGLRLQVVDWPHSFNHRWFVATHPDNQRTIPQALDLGLFSWNQYLRDQLGNLGRPVPAYDDYLRQDLAGAADGADSDLLPQVFEP